MTPNSNYTKLIKTFSSGKVILLFILLAASLSLLKAQGPGILITTPPPGIPAGNALFQKGFLDVTLIGADPTGKTNSTQAIRNAVALARDYDLVCFFPSGTYIVSDTIRCMRKTVPNGDGWRTDNHQCILVGDAANRPLIKLIPGSSNFQNSENPLPVFWFYSMSAYGQQKDCEGNPEPDCGQSNINFNQIIKGIDIDLGKNPGAIGITHPGAQGATIEDVKIDATGAFAGLVNPPGQAGGIYNVEITGGKYGVYMHKVKGRQQGKFTIMTGCVFRNQEIAVVHVDLSQPMVIVGFHIIKEKGPININLPGDGLTLVDGVIELGGGKVLNGSANNIYMQNVYVTGANEITDKWQVSNPKALTRIEEYSYCEPNSTNLMDGLQNKNEIKLSSEIQGINAAELAKKLISANVWNDKSFLHFQSPGVVNVKDPSKMNGLPAVGDGKNDDTKALEYALAHYDKILLPKGNYTISKTLVLGKNTKLFGTDRTLTTITSGSNWPEGDNSPLLSTVDDADATTSLSSVSIRARGHEFSWKAGKNSVVRDVTAGNVTISGNGGGKWYAFMNVGSQMLINGTSQPLAMYATNPERSKDPQWEIRNSQNVRLYYVKTEAGTDGHSVMTSLRISGSKNIMAFGSTGNVTLEGTNGMAMIEVIDSDDILITHVHPFKSGKDWFSFKESYKGTVAGISPSVKMAMFKRGNPVIEVPYK